MKIGDIIDLVAPAGKLEQDELIEVAEHIKILGFIPRFSDNLLSSNSPYHSNSDDYRSNDFLKALNNPDSKAIWCVKGGYGSAKIIDMISNSPIPKQQKLFIGFSDITALHLFLHQKWGWKTIHGPVARNLYKLGIDNGYHQDYLDIFTGKKCNHIIQLEQLNNVKYDNISSEITGGNLTLINNSIGTVWQIYTKNKILLLEDVGEKGYQIDRMLLHLRQSNILKDITALIFGDFTETDNDIDYTLNEFSKYAEKENIPVFKCIDFGHGEKNYPFQYGSIGLINDNQLHLSYDLTFDQ